MSEDQSNPPSVPPQPAALPAQLTVPMILFFLPVLFLVVLGPAVIKVMRMQAENG